MVNVTNRSNVAMRLGTLKLCFGHRLLPRSAPLVRAFQIRALVTAENAPVQAGSSAPI